MAPPNGEGCGRCKRMMERRRRRYRAEVERREDEEDGERAWEGE